MPEERTGDPEDHVVEDVLPGTFSVFNLDQDLSKLYVGGFPLDDGVSHSGLDKIVYNLLFFSLSMLL